MVELFLNEGNVLQSRYRVDSLVSSAGIGQVYKVSDLRFQGKWWAVKAYRGIPQKPFIEEAKILAQIKHPHLVKVVDFFQEKENLCIVMEFVSGRSLDRILEEVTVPLPERQVLSWGIQSADALLELRSQFAAAGPKVFYCRSFSPRKILVSSSGELKIIPDLFLSLRDRALPGVMGFAPPEAFDESQIPDERSDIYSLAAVLYRCLVGESPEQIPFVFVPASQMNSRIVSSAGEALDKATQTIPGNRYPGLRDFRKSLYDCFREVMRGEPRPMRLANQNMSIWWIMMALSGISVILWLFFLW